MAALDPTDYCVKTEYPATMYWNWSLGQYTHIREDEMRTYEWQTDGDNTPPAAIDPDSLIAAGWKIEWRGNTPERDNKVGIYSEIYANRGVKTSL